MKIYFIPLILIVFVAVTACKNQAAPEENAKGAVKTPVSISTVEKTSISESILLNATSAYLRKSEVKATVGGYVRNLNISIGQYVKAGTILFTIKTKEAEALSMLHEKDSLLGIGSLISVTAPVSGIISSVTAQINSYVNDGEVVALLADMKSFVFILHVPFEQKDFTKKGKLCQIILPNETRIKGTVSTQLSEVDVTSQTQSYIITPQTNPSLPENLVVTVELEKTANPDTQVVDKSCVLSDETMENFWVMKLINDSTAIKVPVSRGISSGDRIEILSPLFNHGDRLISTGSYGLPDTAHVSIIK